MEFSEERLFYSLFTDTNKITSIANGITYIVPNNTIADLFLRYNKNDTLFLMWRKLIYCALYQWH
jgi:hypothetical protein